MSGYQFSHLCKLYVLRLLIREKAYTRDYTMTLKFLYIPRIMFSVEEDNLSWLFVGGFTGSCLVSRAFTAVVWKMAAIFFLLSGLLGHALAASLTSVSDKGVLVSNGSWEFCWQGLGEIIWLSAEFPFSVFLDCSDEHDPGAFSNTSAPWGTMGLLPGFISVCTKTPCRFPLMGKLGVFLASYWCIKEMRSIKFFWSSPDASGEASGAKKKKDLWS